LVSALTVGDVQSALRVVNEAADDGADLRQFARDLVERLRALLLLSASNDTSTLDVPDETLQEMQQQAAETNVGQLVAWLKLFSNLDYQLKNSPYGQLPIELAVVEALLAPATSGTVPAPRPSVAPQLAPVAPQRLQPPSVPANGAAPRPVKAEPTVTVSSPPVERMADEPVPAAESEPPVSEPDVVAVPEVVSAVTPDEVIEVVDDAAFLLDDVEACWEQVKQDIRAASTLIFAQLEGVKPINVEDHTIVLLAKRDWQKSKLEVDKTRRLIERHLSRELGSECFFRVTIDEQEEMPDVKKQIQHIRKDELVRSALNIFDATIIAIDKP
jgi:DNA polymerase-3 subunit gamma/tau